MRNYRNNGGDRVELFMANTVATAIDDHYGLSGQHVADLFVADHTHEGLSEGACSIAWEGGDFDFGWTVDFVNTPAAEELRALGLLLEPINSVILGVFREDSTYGAVTDRQLDKMVSGQPERRAGAQFELMLRRVRYLNA